MAGHLLCLYEVQGRRGTNLAQNRARGIHKIIELGVGHYIRVMVRHCAHQAGVAKYQRKKRVMWKLCNVGSLEKTLMIEQQACKVAQPTGSGPRHAVLHGDILVTLREYSTIITSQLVPPLVQNICDTVSNILIVPEDRASLQLVLPRAELS